MTPLGGSLAFPRTKFFPNVEQFWGICHNHYKEVSTDTSIPLPLFSWLLRTALENPLLRRQESLPRVCPALGNSQEMLTPLAVLESLFSELVLVKSCSFSTWLLLFILKCWWFKSIFGAEDVVRMKVPAWRARWAIWVLSSAQHKRRLVVHTCNPRPGAIERARGSESPFGT